MKTLALTSLVAVGLITAAVAETPEQINKANATRTQLGASARDGFTLRGTELIMTRDGVSTKVNRDWALSGGARVHANGNITLADGSTTSLRANQILTFAGDIEDVVLTPEGLAPLSAVAAGPTTRKDNVSSSRDGVTVSAGATFITREGRTEKLTEDVRLANGAIVRPNGTVTLSNGNVVSLKSEQLLDLNGVLHDSRAGRP
ncbi:MAG TPA: DUF6799 domain-containing protein [Chthoniobacter sp.]|nr:DUF6799 domain-containing protein [Chthoniobacter sp.]